LREIDNIEGRYRKDKKFMNALKLVLLLIFFGTSPLITIAAMVIGLLLMIAFFIFGRKYD
jgi:hypothetical protein